MLLGVNIDHIAVLRQARLVNDPDPLDALGIVKRAGADQITIHLREDRRHINDADAKNIINFSHLPVNLECAAEPEIIDTVCELKPHRATIVPEKREEVTTEGGLDLQKGYERLQKAVRKLHEHEIEVSLFIDPTTAGVELSKKLGVEWIELHTGKYANIYQMLHSNLRRTPHSVKELEHSKAQLQSLYYAEIEKLEYCSQFAHTLGLRVAAGHGLNYQNVANINKLRHIKELNIGQSIVARSVFCGLQQAIEDMKDLLA
ncbi:MAG: pyridoxine 5'-phosphate synthase [Campylobacterota bacterium]